MLRSEDIKLDGVMWWSFYEGESSFSKFVDEALKYVSSQPIDGDTFPTTYDRAQELRRLLQNERVLFVLDGFERQLRAYASLDAAYRSHDQIEPSADARSCVDPITSRLLRDIAAVTTRAKVLLTSRLTVSDLQDRGGAALAGVSERDLRELSRDDAISFMRAQGVTKGTDAEVVNACENYRYHALSLRLLSGLIAHDAKMPGDIAAAPRHEVYDDLIQRQHHVLEQSYNALPKRERALLSRIAAFRGPVDYDALSIFNTLRSEKRFEEALDDLRVRGLLQHDAEQNRYDLHPIVRHYAYDRLTDKTGVHARLSTYFARIAVPEAQNVEDLSSVIECYHHTARSGRYDEACHLAGVKLIPRPLFYGFGAYQTCIELLRSLFPDGEDQLPQLTREGDQAWALNGLANSYRISGQARRAVTILERLTSLIENNPTSLAMGMSNLGLAHFELGELATAERCTRLFMKLCQENKNEFQEAIAHGELGRLLTTQGLFEEGVREFEDALKMFEESGHKQGITVTWAYRSHHALQIGDVQSALKAGQQVLRFAQQTAGDKRFVYSTRDFIRAHWLLGSALVMQEADLETAFAHLTEALTRCRQINMVNLEPEILLASARWHCANGNSEEAHTYSDEALAIADRCEYRLNQADTHNFLARLALDAGDRETARKEAGIGKERAWCDGPPHCYKPALDEAERMLKELGAA